MEEYDFLKQCLAERRGLTQPLTAPAVSGSTLSGAQVVSSKVELPEWVSTTPKEPPNAEYYYFLGMSSNDTKYPGDQPIEDFTRRAHRRQAATSPRFEGSSTVTTRNSSRRPQCDRFRLVEAFLLEQNRSTSRSFGHSQISLTADLYGKGTTEVLRQTVDLVGSILAPQVPVAPSVAPSTRRSRPN